MGKSLILDAILVAFLLFSAFVGSRVGLVRSLARLIRLLIAGAGAFFAANLLSPVIALIFLFDGVQKKLAASAQDLTGSVFTAVSGGAGNLGAKFTQACAAISGLAQSAGLPRVMADSVAEKFTASTPSKGETFLDAASHIVSDNIAYIMVFLLTFVIILIITGFLTDWLVGLVGFFVPRFIDRFFGFFFGIIAGCLWVSLFFQFAGNAVPALFQSGSIFSPDVLKNTYLVSYFKNTDFLSIARQFNKSQEVSK